jgi:parvulin-like peptidyl-prolyl isomerase
MMISKFNKLIHNKIIWAGFAVVISLAMVGFFAPAGGGNTQNSPTAMGTLFGEPVTREQFNLARLFNQSFQSRRASDEAEQARMREQTWQRLAILALARQQNITVSDQELSEAIQSDPSFATNGAFDRNRYQQLVQGQMRVQLGTFERYLREEMMLRKMTSLVSKSLWVSPHELERSVSRLTDLFSIQVVNLAYSNMVADVSATPEDVQAFYNENPYAFEVPEMRSVKYVEWPISNFVTTVTVSDEDIQDYYDAHLEEYATTDTNSVTTYATFDDVSDSIEKNLSWKMAIGEASEAAMRFSDDLSDKLYDNQSITLEMVAKEKDLTVKTSGFFTDMGAVPGLKVGLTFTAAAFRLNAAIPDDAFSHTIIGDDAIYVLSADETQVAHVPEFKTVQNDAQQLADDFVKSTAFEERTRISRNQLETAVKAGSDFITTAEEQKLQVQAPAPFSVYEASPEDLENFSAIAPAILELELGDVSEPISTQTGMAIVFVADRQPGDIVLAESIKPDVLQTIQSTRMRVHFETWAENVLAEARAGSGASESIKVE